MKIGAIILSRYNSSRLPGKALMKISGKPVLLYIVERLSQVLSKDQILIATSDQESDDPIKDFAETYNLQYFRGSLENVSERFYLAAKMKDWDYAIRINGDNVFVDTFILKSMITSLIQKPVDFLSNVKDRTFPKGMSIEVVNVAEYGKLLAEISKHEKYREHVTLYLYDNDVDRNYSYVYNTSSPELAGLQMALDTKEDFIRTEKIIATFSKPHWNYNMESIYKIIKLNNI